MVGGLVWAVKFLASVAFVPYVCELLALQLGLGGGRYHYKQAAGLLLIGGVPLLVAVAWVVLLYTARIVSLALEPLLPAADSLFWSSVIGGVLLVAIDLLLDPIAVREGRWGWTPAGGWFGVPLVNFGAWFVTTWLSLMVAGSVAGPLSPVLNHSHRWMILLPVAGLGLSCLHLSLLAGKHGLTKLQPLAIIEAVTLFAFYGVAVLA
jgi:putative membrane protein